EAGLWPSVLVAPGEEKRTLERLAAACDYTILVAPETDGVLQERAERIERAGGRSLGSSPPAIALAADKRAFAAHLARLAIPTPRTETLERSGGLPREFPYPAIIKPADGAGALHTYYCAGPDAAPTGSGLPGAMVIQPYCSGEAMSASFLLGPAGF